MSDEKLLALERVSQAVRSGALSHLALEGICWQTQHFQHIGEACRDGRLTSYELEKFRRQHLQQRYPEHGPEIEDWELAQSLMGEDFIHPYELERFFRQNVRFTDEQLMDLSKIPYSTAVLQENEGSILFPGHPDVDITFLLEAFSEKVGSQVRFVGIDEQTEVEIKGWLPQRLDLRWYLVEMQPTGVTRIASWIQKRVEVPTGYRLPRIIEFATAAFLAEWRLMQAGINESDHPPAFVFSGAWCADRIPKPTYGGNSSFIVGPYEHTPKGKPIGLHVKQVHEGVEVRNVELFLVRERDL